jgi:hypothetical protein
MLMTPISSSQLDSRSSGEKREEEKETGEGAKALIMCVSLPTDFGRVSTKT